MEQTFFITQRVQTEEKITIPYPSFFKSGYHTVGVFSPENIVQILTINDYTNITKMSGKDFSDYVRLSDKAQITKDEFGELLVIAFEQIGSALLPSLAIAS